MGRFVGGWSAVSRTASTIACMGITYAFSPLGTTNAARHIGAVALDLRLRMRRLTNSIRLAVLFAIVVASASVNASDPFKPQWNLDYSISFLSSRHKVFADYDTAGNQGFVGLGVVGRRDRIGPLGLGVSGFVAKSHGDEPSFVQLEVGAILTIDVGRQDGVGVGFRVHPVWSWWLSGDHAYTDPGLGSIIEDVPQLALLIGSEETWVEFGAGGAAHGLDPRVGHLAFNWGAELNRFEVGLAVITAPFVGWTDTDTELVYLGGTASWQHRLSTNLGIGLSVDVGVPLIVGVRLTLLQTLCL